MRLGPQDTSESLTHQSLLRSLNPFTSSPPRPASQKRAASASCTQCTRAFCLNYNLPICKAAEEKDVVTLCFQRDSRKDQVIVWAFILGTTGLLGWAGVKRIVELREGKKLSPAGGIGLPGAGLAASQDRGNYVPVDDSVR